MRSWFVIAPLVLIGLPAQAGLIGVGGTVQATYDNGSFSSTEAEAASTGTTTGTTAPAPLTAPVGFAEGALDGSTISITDTTITITNDFGGFPFCSDGISADTACADAISGFDFLFSGEDIAGVTVDPASAADFLPVTGSFQSQTHDGLQLIGPDEILVDVTGDVPALGDQLTLDLTFPSSNGGGGGTGVPEPSSLALLGSALLGGWWRSRKRSNPRRSETE